MLSIFGPRFERVFDLILMSFWALFLIDFPNIAERDTKRTHFKKHYKSLTNIATFIFQSYHFLSVFWIFEAPFCASHSCIGFVIILITFGALLGPLETIWGAILDQKGHVRSGQDRSDEVKVGSDQVRSDRSRKVDPPDGSQTGRG